MMPIWIIIGLIVSTVSVSFLAAAFSVSGLSELFSGATFAVIAMSSSLELAKFVLAAYLHQAWYQLNLLFKTYLLSAIVVLSVITSMGIFGFLSNAYESTSNVLESENIKVTALRSDLNRVNDEITRINRSIEEIPASRITKRIQARKEAEPALAELQEKAEKISKEITTVDLRTVEVKRKVGPLVYIARAFKVDIDSVVKYLILTFVFVFDPLAICLVLATSQALNVRRNAKFMTPAARPMAMSFGTVPQAPSSQASSSTTGPQEASAPAQPSPETPPQANAEPSGDVIKMRYIDDKDAV